MAKKIKFTVKIELEEDFGQMNVKLKNNNLSAFSEKKTESGKIKDLINCLKEHLVHINKK